MNFCITIHLHLITSKSLAAGNLFTNTLMTSSIPDPFPPVDETTFPLHSPKTTTTTFSQSSPIPTHTHPNTIFPLNTTLTPSTNTSSNNNTTSTSSSHIDPNTHLSNHSSTSPITTPPIQPDIASIPSNISSPTPPHTRTPHNSSSNTINTPPPLSPQSVPSRPTKPPPPPLPQRASTRTKHQPTKLADYHCLLPPSLSKHHHSNFLNYSNLHSKSLHFINSIDKLVAPYTYFQASKHPKRVEAMNKELQALEDNNTWTLTTLPTGKSVIGRKWVFRIK